MPPRKVRAELRSGSDGDFCDRHDFEGLVGQDRQRLVQTRRIHPNLVIADPFKDQRDFLDGWMDEV
jgi:hypothetical protein